MNKIFFTFFLIGFFGVSYAQTSPKPTLDKGGKELNNYSNNRNDTLSRGSAKSTSNKSIKNKDAKITDYLIISHKNDTTFVDTTLTIQKEYKYNYLRKDEFNLMPFSNIGQTYNTLSQDFESISLMPEFGARARHFNYMEIEDINYYHVPTPLTELMYKSAFEQGQLLDAFFTVNTSKQFNFSIAYKGMRSLGNYQHILTSTGNFRFTSSYKTKNRKYSANLHFVSQDLFNEENGGLTDENVLFFESNEEDFYDRGVLEVNFQDAQNILKGKRFYINQKYNIVTKKDSISNNNLNVTHIMSLKDKSYLFEQAIQNDFFGTGFKSSNLRDRVTLEELSNQLQLNYSNDIVGDVQFNVSHTNYNYGYDKLVILNGSAITNRLKGDVLAVGGKYKKQIKGFNLQGELGANVSGDFNGNFLKAAASYKLNNDLYASAQINHNAVAPNYNAQLYQSDYANYNWKTQFNTVKTQQLSLNIKSQKLVNLTLDLTTINDFVYFAKNETDSLVKPFQNDKTITYLRLKVNKEIKYRNFALNNTIMYQNVKDENEVYNVPQVITRNTLYYSNHVFKKAMYLQTGITFNYFTAYKMNAYDPLLAEFYTQNDQEFGGFPRLDFFVNAKIRQTRIYIKAEHFNAAFTGRDYFSAPNTPFRDFKVRFGVVWNFFL
ncbi:putative porin [Lacinutrix jangbogonensis]|uniref:putative porin n=1 Tax=Lacinutrix jangbogonensis TaxID=1469557 RepID=UPI00053E8386|nr:putative porin [Lacinutrix jangbogonensis]